MSDNCGHGLEFRSRDPSRLAFDPGRANHGAGLVLKRIGKVHDGTALPSYLLPVIVGALRIIGKKSEIHVFELLRTYALDKGNFVFHGFELTERFLVIQEAYIGCGKVAVR